MRSPSSVFANEIEIGYYNYFLENKEAAEDRYNVTAEIKQLTPQRYFEGCAKLFGTNAEILKKSREYDKGKDYIKELEEVIMDPSNQFPMTYIDFTSRNQEGLHRMYALGELYGWDKVRFPVLIITRSKEQEVEEKKKHYDGYIWAALQEASRPKYLNFEEFVEELKNQLNDSFNKQVNAKIYHRNGKIIVELDGFTFEYDDYMIKYETPEDRKKKDEEFDKWMENYLKEN